MCKKTHAFCFLKINITQNNAFLSPPNCYILNETLNSGELVKQFNFIKKLHHLTVVQLYVYS